MRPWRPTLRASTGRFEAAADARPDRKLAILLAAERLFAERGFHAVTIRQIAEAAGVPLALVGYHYGPKDALFYAIFERWNETIRERLAALAALESTAPPPRRHAVAGRGAGVGRVEDIVEAFTAPVLRLRASPEGEYYALLVARELMHSRAETDRVLRTFFDPLAHAYIDALHRCFPQAPRGRVAWCYQFALGALLHHLSDTRIERLSRRESRRGDAEAHGLLVAFISGGVRAALAPAARSRKKGHAVKETLP